MQKRGRLRDWNIKEGVMENGNSSYKIQDVIFYLPNGGKKIYRNVSSVDLSVPSDGIEFETTKGELIFSTLPYLLVSRWVKQVGRDEK